MTTAPMTNAWMRALFATAALLFVAAPTAFAADDPVYTTFLSNTALKGYDSVAYHTEGKAVKGSSKFELEWNGAEWRFASQANLDTFKANPTRYAPAYGGYCAWAVSEGYTAAGDPKTWKIVDDVLYLNYNKKVQRDWEKDIPRHIRKANANWPNVLQ